MCPVALILVRSQYRPLTTPGSPGGFALSAAKRRKPRSFEHRREESALVAADALRVTRELEGCDALGVGLRCCSVHLVLGERREREERERLIAVALARQEVAVVRSAEPVHQADPDTTVLGELLELVGIDLVAEVDGDHRPSIGQRNAVDVTVFRPDDERIAHVTRADDEELLTLRRRAYGRGADAPLDASAIARLRELERAASPQPAVVEEAGHAEPPPPGQAASDVDAGPEGSGFGDDPADEDPVLLRWIRAFPTPRRSTVLIAVGTLLIAAVLATTLVLVERVQPDPLQVGARQVARLTTDPFQPVPSIFAGGEDADIAAFEDFHGLLVLIGGEGTLSTSSDACMIVLAAQVIDPDSDSYSGPSFFGCAAGDFPAMTQFTVDEALPRELQSAFPEGTGLQFVWDEKHGEVVVFADR